MNDEQLIKAFFKGEYEDNITIKMMENAYHFPYDEITDYIKQLCSIPYSRFIDYAYNDYYPKELKAEDITQCSDFAQCHIGICNVYKEQGNKAFDFIELGRLLQNDGIRRKDGADRKYGENQVKTAQQLGLVKCFYNKWYCTPLGKVYLDLSPQVQQSLLARTIIRNKLYILLLSDAIVQDLRVIDYLTCIRESTRGRRLGSINYLFKVCEEECKISGISIHHVDFTSNNKSKNSKAKFSTKKTQTAEKDKSISFETISNKNDLNFYINSINQIWANDKGNQIALKKMIMILSAIDFVSKQSSHNTASNKLAILPEWEGLFLNRLQQYERSGTRESTAFSTPFIQLGNEPFWKLISIDGEASEFKRAIMTFERLQSLFEGVEIEKELYIFFTEKDSRAIIEEHICRLLTSKKSKHTVSEPSFSTSNESPSNINDSVSVHLRKYSEYFSNLKTSKNNEGIPFPHKAILLISIIDLIDRRVISNNRIHLSDALEKTFKINWYRYVGHEDGTKCSINYPYYHLSSEPFWNLVKSENYCQKHEYSIKELKQCFSYAIIDEELFNLLTQKKFCSYFRILLLYRYLANFHKLVLNDNVDNNTNSNFSVVRTDLIMRKEIDKSFIGRGFTVPVAYHSKFYEACGTRLKPSESISIKIVFESITYDAQLININLTEFHTEVLQVYWRTKEPKISDALTMKYSLSIPKSKKKKGKDIGIYCTSQKCIFVIDE